MKRTQSIITLVSSVAILLIINVLAYFFYQTFDLTEDRRYSLTQPTQKLIKNFDGKVFIDIYLAGEFPAGFRRLQSSTVEMVERFRSLNKNIDFQLVNPNEGTVDERNQMREKLKAVGVFPMTLNVRGNAESSTQVIFPHAVIRYKDRVTSVKLLEDQTPGMPQEAILNNSITLLEYKFANAFKQLRTIRRPYVVFTEGHGELNALERADLERSLRQFYEVAAINLDSVVQISSKIDALIVAKPFAAFSEQHKFLIDQYVMNGGKTLWLIDKLGVSLDSLRGKTDYVPSDYDLNLDNLFFKYGVRINQDLIQDLQCTKIPQVIGMQGNSPQIELFDWYYHPMVAPISDHPMVKNLDRINFFFPTTLDTIQTATAVKKTILLTSSDKSRFQRPPAQISFEILRYPPQPERFNKAHLPIAVLLEGQFGSVYTNRVSPEMEAGLNKLGTPFKATSQPTKMIVVADGDLAKNFVNPNDGTVQPLGFNPFMRYQFANRSFLLNAVEYLLDNDGVIAARGKEIKLRLLDTVKAQETKLQWQLFDLVLPLVFIIAFGVGYQMRRRRRFARIPSSNSGSGE